MMFPFFEISVGFAVAIYVLETYIDIRQHRKSVEKTRPANLIGIVEEAKFRQAQEYATDKSTFGFISSFFSTVKGLAIVFLGGFPFLWHCAEDVIQVFGLNSEYEVTQSLVFVLLFSLLEIFTSLPFNLYSTFVIEERHGFNKQTIGLFVSDLIKSIVLGIVIGGLVLSALLHTIMWGGERFYIYTWMFMFAFQMFMVAIYPTIIQPLFNKVEPLKDGSLKEKIEKLARETGFPLSKLFVIDGSKRSSHSNAYFYGFFKNKRVVLFDTLIEQMTEEEVIAVLGHEFGHWKMSHNIKNLVISEIHLFVLFYLFGQFVNNGDLYNSFGFSTKPVIIGLILFQFIYSPVEHVLGLFMNMLSRAFEFEADNFAKDLGYGEELKSGLVKLHLKNLGNMNPDRWYSTYHYSHPPLVERLEAIGKKANKSE